MVCGGEESTEDWAVIDVVDAAPISAPSRKSFGYGLGIDDTILPETSDDASDQVSTKPGELHAGGGGSVFTRRRHAGGRAIAADGATLVFDRTDANGNGSLWRVGVDGTGERRLKTIAGFPGDSAPTVSPDGRLIASGRAYGKHLHGGLKTALYVMSIDGRHARPVAPFGYRADVTTAECRSAQALEETNQEVRRTPAGEPPSGAMKDGLLVGTLRVPTLERAGRSGEPWT